jgi:DnaJ-class molecular chaperone
MHSIQILRRCQCGNPGSWCERSTGLVLINPLSLLVLQVVATHCPYRTLGVSHKADEKEIKQAYRKLALQ